MLELQVRSNCLECGTDEAGRGCLAGPVTAAAVILPVDFTHEWLRDSKKLSRKRREHLRPIIKKEALAYAVAHILPREIDQINILQASILAMKTAIDKLSLTPEHIAVDGNRFSTHKNIPYTTVIKGDDKFMNIAAASILAKTYRDDYMSMLHKEYPDYQWNKNQGYPTAMHRAAIRKLGPTVHHRMSFKLLPEQLKLEL